MAGVNEAQVVEETNLDHENAGQAILNMWESEEEAPTESVDESVVEDPSDELLEAEEEELIEESSEDEVEEDNEPYYSVKVDGKELEVNLEELRQGYQRQSDYTRKSQLLAEQRKEIERAQQEAQGELARTQQERQQYAQALQYMSEQQYGAVSEYQNIDWAKLKEDDPYEYMMKRDEYRDAQDRMKSTQAEQARVQQQQAQEYQQQYGQYLEAEKAKLINELPEWGNAESNIKQRIRDYAISQGFQSEELDQLADHRSVLVLKKAMEFDALQKKGSIKKKKVKKVPKVQSAGRGGDTKVEKVQAEYTKKRGRAKKTGNVRDAASAIFDLIE